jgi:hypothetical protein
VTRDQVVKILIFLKEAAAQVHNAKEVAEQANDPLTRASTAGWMREMKAEIARLESMVRWCR